MKNLMLMLLGTLFVMTSCQKTDLITHEDERSQISTPMEKSKSESALNNLKYRISNNPIIKQMQENQQDVFFSSVLFNDQGNVISFILDYENLGIDEDQYLEFMLSVLSINQATYFYDESEPSIVIGTPNISPYFIDGEGFDPNGNTGGGTGNPPMIFKNKRNNNVGGCDPFKGGICVIRW